jgi:UDP-glucose 4-epimerase
MDELLKRGRRVLVTGGAGFIGSHLVERLVAIGAQVTVVDDLSSGTQENISSVLERIDFKKKELGALLNSKSLDLSTFDYIFHLSANAYVPPSVENPEYDFHTTLANTFHLLNAMRQCENAPFFVYMSSAAVYGNPQRLPISESDLTVPLSPYGVSKLASERYVDVFCRLYNLKGVTLRLFSAYGARHKKQVVYDLLVKLKASGGSIEMVGDGTQSRDFLHVSDVVNALLLLADQSEGKGEVYNVASGVAHTINDLVNTWCEVCGLKPQVTYSGQVRSGDADKWSADISRIEKLGYKANVSLSEGLKATLSWYDQCAIPAPLEKVRK